jgi:two-component system C4-dicarboxylate transport response regulator DctD
LENRGLRRQLAGRDSLGPRIIGSTPAIRELRATISSVADTDADVLVSGETGTGKELVALSLHEQSARRESNFVPINCGAIPENLIESELFGHEAGAFTDAREKRVGKFEHASKGTLFLDEIESMPMPVQVRMLRVLQERVIERVGSNQPIPVDIRVVAATKQDLAAASKDGRFRQDLYYRLNVLALHIPPLRERREDIDLLFRHFLLVAGARYGREVPAPKPSTLRILTVHDWPGNVRELRNFADRYVLLGESCGYDADALLKGGESNDSTMTLPQQMDCFERQLIEQALVQSRGSLKYAMEGLGIPRKTLYDKMRKHGLDKSDYKDN